jgi:hypothetical protein
MADNGIVIDPALIQQFVEKTVESNITKLVDQLCADPNWTRRVEEQINQAIVRETLSSLGSVDLNPTIKKYVDENMKIFIDGTLKNFSSAGIIDQAETRQLTVMEENVVVENCLTAKSLEVVESARVQHLVVTGSINTDNHSWDSLTADISQKTLDKLSKDWITNLVKDVTKQIQEQGIELENVRVGNQLLFDNGRLSGAIIESKLQSVGTLKTLRVQGETLLNDTVSVLKNRVGINTDSPEMALSIWDEEVALGMGKFKNNQSYIGTTRNQGLSLGINRVPQLEIDTDGLTTIKKLQIGLHKISHSNLVPGWAGTQGDIVFNATIGADRVFAWICLGGYKWQTLKSAE